MATQTKIGVVGLWHLGCVLSAAWSKLGLSVIGFDYAGDLIGNLNMNKPPIFEPQLRETLKESRVKGRLSFTDQITTLKDCEFVFLAYDTPVLNDDESDLSPLLKAIADLGKVLSNGSVIVVSSQTPVGTCRAFRASLQKRNPTLELIYSPENLRLGEAIACYLKPGRVIVGADSQIAVSKAVALFSRLDTEIITMSIASAEMVKHAINAFLANSIVFVNHLADLCEVSGANILDVVRGVKSDERIGKRAYLSAGIGFSGGTLGRDLRVLSGLNRSSGQKAFLYESVLQFNADRRGLIVDKVTRILGGTVCNKTISVLGLTYKPGTSTLRRSLPLEIVELLAQGGARLRIFDPKADYGELTTLPPFEICGSIDEALSDSDLVVLLTEWDQFRKYPWEKAARLMRQNKIFDPKNFLYDMRLEDKGYEYVGVGFAGK